MGGRVVAERQNRSPVVLRGRLGWGNRKGGLEAWGPGDRWAEPRHGQQGAGDYLGDALEEAGAREGDALLVIAIDKWTDPADLYAAVERFITEVAPLADGATDDECDYEEEDPR